MQVDDDTGHALLPERNQHAPAQHGIRPIWNRVCEGHVERHGNGDVAEEWHGRTDRILACGDESFLSADFPINSRVPSVSPVGREVRGWTLEPEFTRRLAAIKNLQLLIPP